MMNGVILATQGVAGVVTGLSVGSTQTPGPLPKVYGTSASKPSFARASRRSAAAFSPSAMPRALADPSGIPVSEAA